MKKKSVKWLIVLIVLGGLVCVFVFTPASHILYNAAGTVLSPVQNAFTYVGNSVQGWFAYWGRVKTVDVQNQQLQEQIDGLQNQNRDYESMKQENERLRALLEMKDQMQGVTTTGAMVIAKDAGNWFQVFSINKGSASQIQKDFAIIDSKGLIGRTAEVGLSWSKVISLIDPSHSVSGMVSRTGDLVQVDGDMTLAKSGLCKMTVVTEGAEVMIGDTIETSGLGGIYPRGILIGTVQEFKNNESGVGSYAVIKPAVDFQRIKEVLILKTGEGQ